MSNLRVHFKYSSGNDSIDFSFYGGFVINFPVGADSLTVSLNNVDNVDGIGSMVGNASVSARPITIEGYIVGYEQEQLRRLLQRTVVPLRQGKLTAEDNHGNVYYLDCVPVTTPAIEGERCLPRFQLQLSAPYPYWQRTEHTDIPILLTADSMYANVDIQSDVPAMYQLYLTASGGSVSSIWLTDTVSRKQAAYLGEIPDGKTLVISFREDGRVYANIDGTSVINNIRCTLKKLDPGSYPLYISAVRAAGAQLSCVLRYWEGRAGV